MLSGQDHLSLEEASQDLLAYVLDPHNWRQAPNEEEAVPSSEAYQRQVGKLRVRASVDIQPDLQTHLRVAFRGPGLNPMKAADHLETFLKVRLPLVPNSEWQVELDNGSWIHFVRPYTVERLRGLNQMFTEESGPAAL